MKCKIYHGQNESEQDRAQIVIAKNKAGSSILWVANRCHDGLNWQRMMRINDVWQEDGTFHICRNADTLFAEIKADIAPYSKVFWMSELHHKTNDNGEPAVIIQQYPKILVSFRIGVSRIQKSILNDGKAIVAYMLGVDHACCSLLYEERSIEEELIALYQGNAAHYNIVNDTTGTAETTNWYQRHCWDMDHVNVQQVLDDWYRSVSESTYARLRDLIIVQVITRGYIDTVLDFGEDYYLV